MSWQIALSILIAVNVCSVLLNKIATDRLPEKKSKGMFYQYLFCAALATLYALFSGEIGAGFLAVLAGVGTVGFFNAFGNYCQWRAFGLSLSKTVLFLPFMEIVTIFLAVTLLNESGLWNFQMGLGVALCFLAVWLFTWPKKEEEKEKSLNRKKWLFFTAGMIIIMGTAGFLVKLFSASIPRGTFLMGWYIGAFMGTLPLLGIQKANPFRGIPKNTIFICFALGLAILGALFALYWTYQLGGPVSIVLPFREIFLIIIPVFLGWFVFKERKGLSKREWLGFLAGIAGIILILLR